VWTIPYFKVNIFWLKYTKFDFGAGEPYSAPLDPLAGFEGGLLLRVRGGEGKCRGMYPSIEGV